MCALAHLAGERTCLLSQLVFSVENVHINEAVHIAEHIRDEGSVETRRPGAPSHKGTHDVRPSQSQTHSCELALQGRRIVGERRAEELNDRPFMCLQEGVRRVVRHGEIDVVVGMRYHRPERPIRFGEHPAPVGSGEARLPCDGRVAQFHEISDYAFTTEVILHVGGALNDRFDDLSGPRRVGTGGCYVQVLEP